MLQFNNKRLCKLKETIQLYEREGISFVFLRLPNREVIKNEHFTVRPIIRGGEVSHLGPDRKKTLPEGTTDPED